MEPAKERLLSVVFRLNETKLHSLKQLAQKTRIRQSEYLREAIADLLSKYHGSLGAHACRGQKGSVSNREQVKEKCNNRIV